MSRPATAAQLQQPDAFRGQPGQPAPQRLRDAGRDLGGLVPRALGDQQPGQLPDEERVAAAALPQLGGDLRPEGSSRPVPGHRPDVVRREAGEDELLGLAGDLAQQSGRLGVAVRAEQQHGSRRQGAGQEPQQPQRRLVGPVQVVEDDEHAAARRPGGPGTATPPRTAELGVGRRGGARLAAAALPAARRSRTAAASPPRRARPPAGRWPAAPVTRASTVAHRRPPSRTRAGRADPARPGRSARPASPSCRCRPRR